MPTFTTELANRTTRELPLTLAEASQMAVQGLKFAELRPEYGRYRPLVRPVAARPPP